MTFARSLAAATEKGIGRAAYTQSGCPRRADDLGAVIAADGQGLFAVSVLARFNDLQRDFRVSERDSQVDDDINVVARQQVVHAIGGEAVVSGKCLGAIGQDIRAGCELDHVEWRAAADISRRDITRSDDADL